MDPNIAEEAALASREEIKKISSGSRLGYYCCVTGWRNRFWCGANFCADF